MTTPTVTMAVTTETNATTISNDSPEAEVIVFGPETVTTPNMRNGVNRQPSPDKDLLSPKVIELGDSPVASPSLISEAQRDSSLPIVDSGKSVTLMPKIVRATFTKEDEWHPRSCAHCSTVTACKMKVMGTTDTYFCMERCLRLASKAWKASSIQIVVKKMVESSALADATRTSTAVSNGLLSMRNGITTSVALPSTPGRVSPSSSTASADSDPPPKRQRNQRHSFQVESGTDDETPVPVCTCARCRKPLEQPADSLSWEAMEFCSESCLGEYQMDSGSLCSSCNSPVLAQCMGKYCVRFGYDIKQFCSVPCLEKAKSNLRACTFCQRDLSNDDPNSLILTVTDKRAVRYFCANSCMNSYKQMTRNRMAAELSLGGNVGPCAVCLLVRDAYKEVFFQDQLRQLCSEPCYNAFLFVNKMVVSNCFMCRKLYDTTSPSSVRMQGCTPNVRSFCSRRCQNVFLLSNRVIVPCTWCRVKKYNFDMIWKARIPGYSVPVYCCSLTCLRQTKIAGQAKVSHTSRYPCHECLRIALPVCQITMPDGMSRNFCTKVCAETFQERLKLDMVSTPAVISQPLITYGDATSLTASSCASVSEALPVITLVTSLDPSDASAPVLPESPKESSSEEPVIILDSSTREKPKQPVTTPTSTVPRRFTNAFTVSVPVQQCIINAGPEPILQVNKATQCAPRMDSTSIQTVERSPKTMDASELAPKQCCDADTQTDPWMPLLPMPVPIYVPVPLPMYNFPYPVPLGVPIPFPLPIPIISRLAAKEALPSPKLLEESQSEESQVEKPEENPDKKSEKINESQEKRPEENTEEPSQAESMETNPVVSVPSTPSTSSSVNHLSSSSCKRKAEEVADLSSSQESSKKARKFSSGPASEVVEQSAFPTEIPGEVVDVFRKEFPAKEWPPASPQMALGLKAWKLWVASENKKLTERCKAKVGPASRKPKLQETDLLQLRPPQLAGALTRMFEQPRKPDGTRYNPDTLYYFVLGIQSYLNANDRKDCLFYDKDYCQFQVVIDGICQGVIKRWTIEHRISQVREEHLWEARLLGVDTPQILLFTLAYFNTKYFGLKSLEDHAALSFKHLVKRWRRIPNSERRMPTSLTYTYPLVKEDQERDPLNQHRSLKLVGREDIAEKCAIRIYEFYLAKCPSDANPKGSFYLAAAPGSTIDALSWYTTQPQAPEELKVNLHRILSVADVQQAKR